MSRVREAHEIVQLIASASPQIEEEVAAVSSVLRSWGYDVRVMAPLTRPFARQLKSVGVRAQDVREPTGDSVSARYADVRHIARLLRAANPLLVHAHGLRSAAAAAVARHGAPRPPLVVSPHALPHLLDEDPKMGLRGQVSGWLLRRADAVVVETQTQREDLGQFDEQVGERAEMVPYSLPVGDQPDSLDLGRRRSLLGITQGAVVIGCVVDALEEEALEMFLGAAASVCMDYPSLEFALIGREMDISQMQERAHARGVLGATVFVDPHDRFRRAIAALNVLVTPQRGWPSGMLALQALAAEVGVVAIEGGEVAEMLMGHARVTLASADGAEALGQAIIRRLRVAAQQMRPEREQEVETPSIAPFLVSRAFYDLGESWATPERHGGAEDDTAIDPAETFAPTKAARALIGIYQRLLE